MKNKIFIPVVIGMMVVGIAGLFYFDVSIDDTVNTTQKELEVETKKYRDRLPPPPESIFEGIVNVSGTDEAIKDTEGRFSHLYNIFDGYDEMMVFVYDPGLPPPDVKTTILLSMNPVTDDTTYQLTQYKTSLAEAKSMNPVTDDTTYQGFIYHEEGIRIDSAPTRGSITQDSLLRLEIYDGRHFPITSEITGQLTPMRVQTLGDETYDLPAKLQFIADENIVTIRGFLTDDRILTLATALL